MKVLVTGANGFVGSQLLKTLENDGHEIVGAARRKIDSQPDLFIAGEISAETDWSQCLTGCDTVIHTAGRAHILNDKAQDKLAEFRKVNCEATTKLAQDALAAGVRHFIFISSIGVNGNATDHAPFSESSQPKPVSEYAISKYEAEEALKALLQNTTMDLTIIRPALICGHNAPGNIRRLLKLVSFGVPLPFKGINNIRAMASLDNVVSFIAACVGNDSAKNELFLLADKEKLSTGDVVTLFSQGMGKKQTLFYFPATFLKAGLSLLGKKNIYEQLYGNLDVDSRKAYAMNHWTPVTQLPDTLKSTAAFFKGLK